MKRSRRKVVFDTPDEYFAEALRYFRNAKERLREARVELNRYTDVKPVREACATAYLAVLLALDGHFVQQGMDRRGLPASVEEYQAAMNKHLVHNGKVRSAFYNVYEDLHVFGYYRGACNATLIKQGFGEAGKIVGILTGRRI